MLKRKSTRIIAIIMAAVMMIGLMPTAVFADETPKTIYVDATNGDDTKDGTSTNPVKSIAKALEKAGDGTTIYVAAGTYDGSLIIDDDVTIVGPTDGEAIITISESTVGSMQKLDKLDGESSDYYGIVAVKDATVTISNITIKGNPEVVSKQTSGQAPDLVHNNRYAGLVAINADVTLNNCDIKDITYTNDLQGMQNGSGIYAVATGNQKLTLNDVNITNFNKTGVLTRSTVELEMNGGFVVGFGSQSIISQNGIQYAGDATINGTTLSGLQYTADNEWKGGSVALFNVGVNTTSIIENVTTTSVDYAIDVSETSATTIVKSGTYQGNVYAEPSTTEQPSTSALSIVGGTFTNSSGELMDVSGYVPAGMQQNSDGSIGVNEKTAVAVVDGVGYTNIQDAIAAAEDGDTIKVTGAIEGNVTLNKNIKNLTITGTEDAIIKNGSLTVASNGIQLPGLTIEKLRFENANILMSPNGASDLSDMTIRNNTFTGAISNGSAIHFNFGSLANGSGASWDGMTITGNMIKDVASGSNSGILIIGDGTTASDLSINGNIIDGVAWNGIQLNNIEGNNILVTGNNIRNCGAPNPDGVLNFYNTEANSFKVNENIIVPNEDQLYVSNISNDNVDLNRNYWGTSTPDFENGLGYYGEGISVTVDEYYLRETMRAEDLNTYEPPYTGDYNYPVTVKDSDNGTVTIAKEDQWANDGEKITVTVTPDDAYMLDKLVITDKAGNELEFVDNGDGTYTFTMPKGAVTITATFVEDPNWEEPTEPEEPNEPALPFSDVHEGDWFYDVVKYVYDEGLMTGTSATTFEPNTTTTRGMIVSILHRLEGSPVVTGSDFTDVNDSDWYGQAVAWAAENGIVNGFEDSTFRPNAAITREQMAAILYNYADYKGYDVNSRANLDAYSDADQISSWASDVVAWANAEGLINGMTANTLEPQGNATRAQVAAIFQRFLAE